MERITAKEAEALAKIAAKHNPEIKNRGGLDTRYNDSEDFVEVSVWGLAAMLEEAYRLGQGEK